MKKQGSDQAFHDRRYQERKRAEAARKPVKKTNAGEAAGGEKVDAAKSGAGSGKWAGEGKSR